MLPLHRMTVVICVLRFECSVLCYNIQINHLYQFGTRIKSTVPSENFHYSGPSSEVDSCVSLGTAPSSAEPLERCRVPCWSCQSTTYRHYSQKCNSSLWPMLIDNDVTFKEMQIAKLPECPGHTSIIFHN